MPICAKIRNDARVSGVHDSILVAGVQAARSDAEILRKEGVHVGFGETDELGREFDEGQAALPHQVVNGPLADVQAPRDLRLGFVIRRGEMFSCDECSMSRQVRAG